MSEELYDVQFVVGGKGKARRLGFFTTKAEAESTARELLNELHDGTCEFVRKGRHPDARVYINGVALVGSAPPKVDLGKQSSRKSVEETILGVRPVEVHPGQLKLIEGA